jgi:probable F420-dependent oxidoreductase
MKRPGITIPHEPFQNQHLAELARTAERCGYTDAWSYESFGADAFSPIAAASMVTSKLRFGSAIVPVFSRPAPLIAMAAITTNQLSGGRFILGLGISTPNIMQGWMGVPFRKPVTMMKETVAALRQIFTGEKVTFNGEMVHINGFKIDIPFDKPPLIYIGAQGSKMLRIAGEIGDGLIVNFVTPETLPAMLEHTREGMRAVGKDPTTLDVACRIMLAVDEDEGTVRTIMKRSLTAYVTVPQYNKFFREIGFENEAGTAIDAWNAGDRKKALEAVTDEMVEKIFVIGNAAKAKRRLDDYARGGITTSALQFSSFAKTPEERRKNILSAIEKVAAA